ncbi:MAG: histidine kinase dimerization/phospho-acceptor domain-containing protein, partial [Ghiorsea sp.]
MNKMLSSHEPQHHAALNREQLLTFIQLRKKTYIPIALVIIMTWALWDSLPPLYLFSWMGCVLLTVIPRYLMIPTTIEGLADESIKQRTFVAWMLTMAYCATWGVGAVVCMDLLPLMKQMMIMMLLVGLTGAVMGYVTDKKYAYGVHSLTIPVMIWLLTQDRGGYLEMGLMMVLYVLFMQFSLGSQYQRFTRSVMMRFENEVLLEQLQEQMEEKERIAQKLGEKSKDAEQANKAKTEFVSVVSHELRTPVHGLIGMLDLLNGVCLNKESREDLKNARRA